MVCPFCGNKAIKITNSRKTKRNNQVWRRRQCESCGRLFSTRESVDLSDVVVISEDSKPERYSKAKLATSLLRACDHRNDRQSDDVFALLDTVEAKIIGRTEMSTADIAEFCMEVLSNFDEVASVKYRSYYC